MVDNWDKSVQGKHLHVGRSDELFRHVKKIETVKS